MQELITDPIARDTIRQALVVVAKAGVGPMGKRDRETVQKVADRLGLGSLDFGVGDRHDGGAVSLR